MNKRITIDPITRLEGHGRIEIFLDARGDVEAAYLQAPDFRGFEKLCEKRAAEEMPVITQKVCGVCPTAHHTAASKALDGLYGVEPPPAAKKIRELIYSAFMFEDHLLHFYFLGGPDFLLGPGAPREKRNIFGVMDALGKDAVKAAIDMRRRVREAHAALSGSPLYPVHGLAGGVSKPLAEEERARVRAVSKDAIGFAQKTLGIFRDAVLENSEFREMLESNAFSHRTHYMGMVDESDRVNFYDGKIRVVGPSGEEVARFDAGDYLKSLAERVDPISYAKVVYLKKIGWRGYTDREESGVFRVGPLARLNASCGMATPLAHAEYESMMAEMGEGPVHNTLAYHWARLVEVLYAAERMDELAGDEGITDPEVRALPRAAPAEGVGACEAPRGTLIHHYRTDNEGMIREANLLVATQNNAAAIGMSIEKAASTLIRGGLFSEEALNKIEMTFRAYDPCMACATHLISGERTPFIYIYDKDKRLIRSL